MSLNRITIFLGKRSKKMSSDCKTRSPKQISILNSHFKSFHLINCFVSISKCPCSPLHSFKSYQHRLTDYQRVLQNDVSGVNFQHGGRLVLGVIQSYQAERQNNRRMKQSREDEMPVVGLTRAQRSRQLVKGCLKS